MTCSKKSDLPCISVLLSLAGLQKNTASQQLLSFFVDSLKDVKIPSAVGGPDQFPIQPQTQKNKMLFFFFFPISFNFRFRFQRTPVFTSLGFRHQTSQSFSSVVSPSVPKQLLLVTPGMLTRASELQTKTLQTETKRSLQSCLNSV